MRSLLVLTILCLSLNLVGQVTLTADGPGDTYELITAVLAPDENPIETPDCGHEEFGRHIDEVFDEELGAHAFRFFIHTDSDDDRCINFDRQRNEIKSYSKSPENLLGRDGETVIYQWKFKLDSAFQSSPNFTHLFQIKAVGGDYDGLPMYTLTTRDGNPDQLELRYAELDDQETLKKIPLTPLLGKWLEVYQKLTYGEVGAYEIRINDLATGEELFSYQNDALIHWRPGTEFFRPKWGIYRSLINSGYLRDEEVRFADFSIEEEGVSSSTETTVPTITVSPNPATTTLTIDNLPLEKLVLTLYTLDGNQVRNQQLENRSTVSVDVSQLDRGLYLVSLKGDNTQNVTKVIIK